MSEPIVSQSFIISKSLKAFGCGNFLDELGMEIQTEASAIGLDEYCKDGGSIGEVWVEDLELNAVNSSGIISGSFSLSFEESYYAGCRDLEWSNKFAGSMDFELDMGTHELTITNEEIRQIPEEEEEEEAE